jgi:hypothetical protein
LSALLRFSFQINARRINDELNVFKDLHKSPIFIGVLIVTAGLQVGWLLSSGSCVVCMRGLAWAADWLVVQQQQICSSPSTTH